MSRLRIRDPKAHLLPYLEDSLEIETTFASYYIEDCIYPLAKTGQIKVNVFS
jgi:hypothetical protein